MNSLHPPVLATTPLLRLFPHRLLWPAPQAVNQHDLFQSSAHLPSTLLALSPVFVRHFSGVLLAVGTPAGSAGSSVILTAPGGLLSPSLCNLSGGPHLTARPPTDRFLQASVHILFPYLQDLDEMPCYGA